MTEELIPFGAEETEVCTYEDCRVAILPIPYEGTVSYGGGTSKGPAALLEASANLEYYDEELDQDTCNIGIHTLPTVESAPTPAEMMDKIREAASKPVKEGKFLCAIGGEHSVTRGVLDALVESYGKDFGVLQLDAHADLRDKYDESPHSHACIMRRVHDMGLPYAQTGIRSMSREEADFVKENKRKIFFARDIQGETAWMDEILKSLPDKVFITIDIDCLDPSIMPSTGTPEPGGLDWHTTTAFLKKVAQKKEVIGFDLVELAPIEGLSAPDFLAAKLVYRLLGYIFKI